MAKKPNNQGIEALAGSFGFDPDASAAHFLVHVPTASSHPVEISEHLSWNPERIALSQHYGVERDDGQVRCRLPRVKWNEIAEVLRAEFNVRLKREGTKPGRWKTGYNPVTRLLGKELTLLAWAIEDADPALIPAAVANWQGLTPEERWWLYTMTAAATGNFMTGRNRGWRKAVRYALTENPVTNRVLDQPVVPEFFRLVSETPAISASDGPIAATDAGDFVGEDTSDPEPSPVIQRLTDTAELLKPASSSKSSKPAKPRKGSGVRTKRSS
jgi:hypothetical protein